MYDRMTMQIVYDIVGNGEGGGREARFQSAIIVDILDLDYVVSSVFGGGGCMTTMSEEHRHWLNSINNINSRSC